MIYINIIKHIIILKNLLKKFWHFNFKFLSDQKLNIKQSFLDKNFIKKKLFFLKLQLLLAVILVVPVNSNSFADEIQNISNQQDIIIRNQQNFNDYEARLKEQQAYKKDGIEDQEPKFDIDLSEEIDTKNKKCKIIRIIKFNDTEVLSNQIKENLSYDILNQCYSNKKISKLIERITDIYDQKGFISTEVEISSKHIDQGIIEVKIIEKKIEEIIFNNKKSKINFLNKINKFTIFGNIEHQILNNNDLQQGIFQLNKLSSNQASYQILNGSKRDLNKVVIDNKKKKLPFKIFANHDNLGNRSTGLYRSNFSSSLDNFLSLNENINIGFNTNLNDNPKDRDIKTYTANIQIPLAYYTLGLDYLQSDFYGKDFENRNFSGFAKRKNITINKLFTENKDYRISAKIGFTKKETASYLENKKVENSQRSLSIIHGSILATYFINSNNTLFLKPSLLRGIKQFDAKRDYSFANPKLDFTIFKFYSSYQKKFSAFNLNRPLIFITEIDSQIANKRLFGSEQFSIGGYTSVRGFRERNIAGEKGFYWRNKIELNVGSIFQKINSSNHNFLYQTRIEPFLDYGYVERFDLNKKYDISGTGLKTIFSSKNFTSSITFSWALKQSNDISSRIKENKMIYFEINTNCCSF